MPISQEIIESLILKGAVEFAGVDTRGEVLFSFTDKIHELAPAVYQVLLDMQSQDIQALWVNGFIEMDDPSALNPMLTPTAKAFIKEELEALDQNQLIVLEQLIQLSQK